MTNAYDKVPRQEVSKHAQTHFEHFRCSGPDNVGKWNRRTAEGVARQAGITGLLWLAAAYLPALQLTAEAN